MLVCVCGVGDCGDVDVYVVVGHVDGDGVGDDIGAVICMYDNAGVDGVVVGGVGVVADIDVITGGVVVVWWWCG